MMVGKFIGLIKKINKKKLTRYSLGFLGSLALLLWLAVFSRPDQDLHIKFYDVGQGDSIFIQTPSNKQILIDGGPDEKVVNYLGADLPYYDRDLDLVILTHPHSDHVSGLIEVIKRYEVKQILMNKLVHTTNDYIEWLDQIEKKKISVREIFQGERIDFSDGAIIKVLWPTKEFIGDGKVANLNLASVVLELKYGDFSTLLTGDAEDVVQGQILGATDTRQIDVLKVPHQGAGDSLDIDFLDRLDPKLAVISVGEGNRFGHPAEKTLEKLKEVEVLRTDEDGTIEIISDGRGWWRGN